MLNEVKPMMDLEQVQEIYFQLFPTAKELLNKCPDMPLAELFKPVLEHKVDYKTYPNAQLHMQLLRQEISSTHNVDVAEKTVSQFEQSFVVNEMVHLSLMRSFDRPVAPFVDEVGKVSNAHNYNSLIFQAEALWGGVNALHGNNITFSCNAGMVYIENETSPAYLQTSQLSADAVKIFKSSQKGAMLTHSSLIRPEYLDDVLKASKSAHLSVQMLGQQFTQTFNPSSSGKYNQKIALLYSKQLDSIFPHTKHVNVDGIETFTGGMQALLKDNTSLMHYVFSNKPVLASMANHFAGVKSGWREVNEADEHTLFFKLKQEKEGVVTGRDPFYSYDIEKIIAGLENKEILPRTALYFIYNFLEVGLVSLGGTAQAPYLTELKGRMLGFLDEMSQNIEVGIFPNCPIDKDNLAARYNKIKDMPTEIPIGGLAVAANKEHQLYCYSDHLSGELLPDIDLTQITVKDAINATMPTLITHKCMKPKSFLVGAQEITVPKLDFSGRQRYDISQQFPSKIWTPKIL